MNRAVKNILKIILVGLATTIVRMIGQLSIPAGADGPAAQCFRAKRHHAAVFHCLWDFRLLSDLLAVSAYSRQFKRQSDFTGAEIRHFLLHRVDRLSFRTAAACSGH